MNALELILANQRRQPISVVSNNQLAEALQNLPLIGGANPQSPQMMGTVTQPQQAADTGQLPIDRLGTSQGNSMTQGQLGVRQEIPSPPPSESRTLTSSSVMPQLSQPTKRRGIFSSDVAQVIGGIARGLASGTSLSDSIGLGGVGALDAAQTVKRENETYNWLKAQGMSDQQAETFAKDRALLGAFLAQAAKAKDKYEFRTAGTDVVRVDPATGDADLVYKGTPKSGAAAALVGDLKPVTLDAQGKPNKEDQENFLMTSVPAEYREQVKAIAEGRASLKDVPVANGARERVQKYVYNYDPTYSVNDAKNKERIAANYLGGGDMFKSKNAANLAISHLTALNRAYNGLGNAKHSSTMMNKLWNTAAHYLPEGQRTIALAEFERARRALADELAKVFSAKGATSETAATTWANSLSPDLPPEAWNQAMKQIIHLLAGRSQSYRNGYEEVFGEGSSPAFLDKETVDTMIKDLGFSPREISQVDPRFDFSKLQNGQ